MTLPTAKYEIHEEDLDDLTIECAGVPHPHGIIGFGYGSRDCQARYTYMNPSWKGAWFEEIWEDQYGFSDPNSQMVADVVSQYNARQADKSYKATFSFLDLGIRPRPGDYINLYPLDEPLAFLQVQDVQSGPNEKIILQMGKRKQDEVDAFNAKKSLSNAYIENYMIEETNSISASGTLTIGDDSLGWGTPWSSSFTIPAAVNNAGNNSKVTMDLGIKITNYTFIGECTVYFTLAGYLVAKGYFHHYMLGDTISGIDVTDYVNYGTATALVVYCRVNGVWSPSSAPSATTSAALHAWRRNSI